MADRQISQSELARRVGVSQATIFKLVSGQLFGSKHLHKIARELGTTPAYLSGETDDPEGNLPDAPELSSETREMIERFESMALGDRRALLQVVRAMTSSPTGVSLHSPKSGFRGRGE